MGGFDSKDLGGYVDLVGLKMSMTSSDIFDYEKNLEVIKSAVK